MFRLPPDKSFLRLWNKIFQVEICRNIRKTALQLLREWISWASRNGAVQICFLAPTPTPTNQNQNTNTIFFSGGSRNMVLGVLWEYNFILLIELRFAKWVSCFKRNCIVKWVIVFVGFCWLQDFLPENLKIVDKVWIWGF